MALLDLALEGVGLELLRLGETPLEEPPIAAGEVILERQRSEMGERFLALEQRIRDLDAALLEARAEAAEARAEGLRHRRTAAEVKRVLDAVEASWSFRLGRLLTAPGRWVRRPRRT